MISILHVASFKGNTGDNANHMGMRRIFGQVFGIDRTFHNVEIRKAYQNYHRPDKLYFNNAFAEQANKHDMVIFGGGNFFDLGIEPSHTGTTIDMSVEVLKKIKVPIIFHGMGVDYNYHTGPPEHLIHKFRDFIECAVGMENCTVSVRNDGSLENMQRILGTTNGITRIPDGGFFTSPNSYYHPELPEEQGTVIAVNIANDMKDRRFQLNEPGAISYDIFTKRMCGVLSDKLTQIKDLHIIFVPHIYSDLEAISDVIMRMDDSLRRNRVSVSPYIQGDAGADYIFDLYRRCNLVLGMRFHANVCPIGLTTPTLGLVSYPQISGLYRELGFQKRMVAVDKIGFEKELSDKIDASLELEYKIKNQYEKKVEMLEAELLFFHSTLKRKYCGV